MELKVWVEGIQRIVCGVNESTSCQDVVFALAHATGRTGRFTLIERWRNNERILAPNENPLKILMKWGEYSSDVQFVLQRSDQKAGGGQQPAVAPQSPPQQATSPPPPPQTKQSQQQIMRQQQKLIQQQQQSDESHSKLIINATAAGNEIAHQNMYNGNNNNNKDNIMNAHNLTIASPPFPNAEFLKKKDPQNVTTATSLERNRDQPKGFHVGSPGEHKHPENVGIVKGIPQKPSNMVTPSQKAPTNPIMSPISNSSSGSNNTSMSSSYDQSMYQYGGQIKMLPAANSTSPRDFNAADLRNSLDRKLKQNQYNKDMLQQQSMVIGQPTNLSHENLVDIYNIRQQQQQQMQQSLSNSTTSSTTSVGLSPSGALVPPPYRDPPRPRSSPLSQQQQQPTTINLNRQTNINNQINLINNNANNNGHIAVGKDSQNNNNNNNHHNFIFNNINDINDLNEMLLHNSTQYRDLLQLIKYQRDKITLQQTDLTKFDSEIVYLEAKGRDQLQQLDAIKQEISKTDQIFRQGNEQLQTLQYVEEESEIVRQQEKTLKSEITLLRSKLANCETELLQCKNKIRLMLDEIQVEQRAYSRQYDNRQQIERHLMTEVDRIQAEIELAIQSSEVSSNTAEGLKKEVAAIETAILEKKKQVEQLVHEMKEVNLQSLAAVGPAEEVRALLEGSLKPGSTRRIIGSPRQLENAVPTSKNPHGVWV